MAEFLNIPENQIVMFCNGTLALMMGMMAFNVPHGKYCLLPSWTFSATPASAKMAGFVPYFLDVDRDSQSLTPEIVRDFLKRSPVPRSEIGAVMAVSPFGSPISRLQWDLFTGETGIPVMIDAAASFDAVHRHREMNVGKSPIMVSMHATKIFGIGEGGFLISSDTDYIAHVKGMSNFGFDISRLSSYIGLNAKMSEYQAAIGLAVLDSWEEIRAKRLKVTRDYIHMLQGQGLGCWLSEDYLTSTCNALIPNQARNIRDYLISKKVESRVWWGDGCHTHPAYCDFPVDENMENTKYLGNCMVGLPFSIDTSKSDIEYIGNLITDYLDEQTQVDADEELPRLAIA
jgi:dTDP-4-amino-4,6-dideoxygalactose transaminase